MQTRKLPNAASSTNFCRCLKTRRNQGCLLKPRLNYRKRLDLDKCTDLRFSGMSPGTAPEKGETYGHIQRRVDQEALSQSVGSACRWADSAFVGGHPGHGHLRGDCRLRQLAGHRVFRQKASVLVQAFLEVAKWHSVAPHF